MAESGMVMCIGVFHHHSLCIPKKSSFNCTHPLFPHRHSWLMSLSTQLQLYDSCLFCIVKYAFKPCLLGKPLSKNSCTTFFKTISHCPVPEITNHNQFTVTEQRFYLGSSYWIIIGNLKPKHWLDHSPPPKAPGWIMSLFVRTIVESLQSSVFVVCGWI